MRTVVYDPNGQNPYGRELAALLVSLGRTVVHWVPPGRSYRGGAALIVRAELGGPVDQASRRIETVVRRLISPVRAIVLQPLGAPVIAAWNVDVWDAALLGLRSLVSRRVFVVLHNPRQVAGRGGRWARLERYLLRRCVMCLHSQRLADLAAEDFPHRVVTPHPPYATVVAHFPGWSPALASRGDALPVLSFIGDPRPDKGVGDLAELAEAIPEPFVLRILGGKPLPEEIAARVRAGGHSVEQSEDGHRPTDDELVEGLLTSSAVAAPYRSVTDSGSVRLATAVGVPVLAYDTDGLRDLLPSEQLADDFENFARLVSKALHAPTVPYGQPSLEDQRQRSLNSWKEIFDGRH